MMQQDLKDRMMQQDRRTEQDTNKQQNRRVEYRTEGCSRIE